VAATPIWLISLAAPNALMVGARYATDLGAQNPGETVTPNAGPGIGCTVRDGYEPT
jgi:hypothetical protein